MNERWEKLQRLYHAARELDGEQRSHFLTEACRSDPDMRQQIDAFLQQDREQSSFLNAPAVDLAAGLRPMLEIRGRLSRCRIDTGECGLQAVDCFAYPRSRTELTMNLSVGDRLGAY